MVLGETTLPSDRVVNVEFFLSRSSLLRTKSSATRAKASDNGILFTIAIPWITAAMRQASYVHSRWVRTVVAAMSATAGRLAIFLYSVFIC